MARVVALGALLAVCACQRTSDAPLANCDRVAETLATIEVGNYAPLEQRAAAEAHHRDACVTAKVTEAEATCLTKARDTWSAARCVPRMFPKPVGNVSADCAQVVERVHAAIRARIDQVGSDAKTMIDKMLPAMQASCVEDGWPAPLVQCILATKPGDLPALEQCNAQMPKALQDKLQARMAATQKP